MLKDLPGHEEIPLGRIGNADVTFSRMAPDARDCLDVAMERWAEHKARMPIQPEDEVYAFAYWLLRYSGLVVPANRAHPAEPR